MTNFPSSTCSLLSAKRYSVNNQGTVYNEGLKRLLFSPMGGVANVCRPTSWAGPRPSRKSLNWASEESLTPGKMRLEQRRHKHGDERYSFIPIRHICRGAAAVRKSLELFAAYVLMLSVKEEGAFRATSE